jgi:dihydroorotase
MANTVPPVDSPGRVGQARARGARHPVRVHPAAAVTRGLRGEELVDIPGCAAAGAVAFTDDGRNAAPPRLLETALRSAGDQGRCVMIHPEDEGMVLAANPGVPSVMRCPERPPACEHAAVETALRALVAAGRGRLHLQHLTCALAIDTLREARELGLAVTAEATPHHLAMWLPFEREPEPVALRKVNPPLRSEADREALVQALRDGVIDAVATDHAPHSDVDKTGPYGAAAPGMVGLETAFAACLTLGGMGGDWLPVLVERLTAGPWRVLGPDAGIIEPRLRVGEKATLTLFDADAEWTVGDLPWRSQSRNTPLMGARLRGRILLTIVEGAVAYLEPSPLLRLGFPEVATVG